MTTSFLCGLISSFPASGIEAFREAAKAKVTTKAKAKGMAGAQGRGKEGREIQPSFFQSFSFLHLLGQSPHPSIPSRGG